MNTVMGVHEKAIVVSLVSFVVLHALRLLITRAIAKRRTPLSNLVDLDSRRMPTEPDPSHDEHVAFPEDSNLVDLATVRARRG